jgi:hypothetical protein
MTANGLMKCMHAYSDPSAPYWLNRAAACLLKMIQNGYEHISLSDTANYKFTVLKMSPDQTAA